MAEHKHRLAHQFVCVGNMAKSADFGFCALPTNRIITKAKPNHASHLLGLSRLDVYAHVSASETLEILHWRALWEWNWSEHATTDLVNRSPRFIIDRSYITSLSLRQARNSATPAVFPVPTRGQRSALQLWSTSKTPEPLVTHNNNVRSAAF
jgi:hypothetical protein